MQQYSFSIRNGGTPPPDTKATLPNAGAAQALALAICSDLARDILPHLESDDQWRVSVSDETGKAIYRVSIIAETLK
jgi:hypothetical protein